MTQINVLIAKLRFHMTVMKNDFILPLSKLYFKTRNAIVWACSTRKGFWQGIDKFSKFWINFVYVAGHMAALIIISIQCQLQTNEGSPT